VLQVANELLCAVPAGCKSNDVQIVYTPWGNLKKTASMDVGQVRQSAAAVSRTYRECDAATCLMLQQECESLISYKCARCEGACGCRAAQR
jgi:hypothetical protein